ncbi:MAG: KAP family P-loop NTPase fold protein, partial [Dehalococcoidales bacterium]
MFNSDKPIKSKTEDILRRSQFAEALGQSIINYKAKDSLVIGLFGEWGSGKSSIINMVEEYIESIYQVKNRENKPIIIKFNPWNYSNQNQLVTQFFNVLSIALNRADYVSGAKKIGKKLELYSKFFDILMIIPTAGSTFEKMSSILKNAGKALKGWAETKSQDLETIKSELNELLEKQPNKVIVIIDDIDRLSNTEIAQVFQLVKSLGDFSNTIYFLAFDKKVIISSLEELQKGFGLQYLEKVVQVPFEIPLMPTQELQRFFLAQLDELIKEIP